MVYVMTTHVEIHDAEGGGTADTNSFVNVQRRRRRNGNGDGRDGDEDDDDSDAENVDVVGDGTSGSGISSKITPVRLFWDATSGECIVIPVCIYMYIYCVYVRGGGMRVEDATPDQYTVVFLGM